MLERESLRIYEKPEVESGWSLKRRKDFFFFVGEAHF